MISDDSVVAEVKYLVLSEKSNGSVVLLMAEDTGMSDLICLDWEVSTLKEDLSISDISHEVKRKKASSGLSFSNSTWPQKLIWAGEFAFY